ncbi:MAG: hypothetical protein GXZ08_02435 [Tissierellia bacterium]|nr:hypothetical protein [Tissierellia bacterium]
MISTKGLEKEIAKFNRADRIQDELVSEMNKVGLAIVADIKDNTPIGETGFLKKGTDFENAYKDGKDVALPVYNNVEYAAHVNYGHRTVSGGYVPGTYFFTGAEPIGKEMVKRAVEKVIEKVNAE